MRKLLFFLILSVLFVSGCGQENIQFSGESENWEGSYSAYVDDSKENGEYVFGYKKAEKDIVIKNLKIDINDGEIVLNEAEHKGATIKIPTGCSGCAVTSEDNPIGVTIEWGEGKVETFSLEPK